MLIAAVLLPSIGVVSELSGPLVVSFPLSEDTKPDFCYANDVGPLLVAFLLMPGFITARFGESYIIQLPLLFSKTAFFVYGVLSYEIVAIFFPEENMESAGVVGDIILNFL
jgi:hypothetical protein